MECPVCGCVLVDEQQTVLHVERHFSSDGPSTSSFSLIADGYDDVDQVDKDRLMAEQMQLEELRQQESAATALAMRLQAEDDSSIGAGLAPQLQQRGGDVCAEAEHRELQLQYGMTGVSVAQQLRKNLDREMGRGALTVSDLYEIERRKRQAQRSGVDDGLSVTSGVLPRLREYYQRLAMARRPALGCSEAAQQARDSPDAIVSALLAADTDHYRCSYEDSGWGCGYRNLQMLISSLRNHHSFQEDLFGGKLDIPSISKLQSLIERAWKRGYDTVGAAQLGGTLTGTRKWIGATEVAAMLASCGVRVRLLDLHRPSAPDGTHPLLFDTVRQYFNTAEFRAPIYLQHEGHSRTIIGIEVRANATNNRVLLFDPGHRGVASLLQPKEIGRRLNGLRKGLQELRHREYQLLLVTGMLRSEADREAFKLPENFRERLPP